MHSLLLAAGYGTRLYPLTKDFPKPLLKVGKHTALDRLVDQIEESGCSTSITVVTNNRFFAHFRSWADARRAMKGTANLFLINDGSETNESRLGAVGDMHMVLSKPEFRHLTETDLLVCACDNVVGFDFDRFVNFYYEGRVPCVAVHPESDPHRLQQTGVVVLDKNGYVEDMEEKPGQPKSTLAACPFYIFPPSCLKMIAVYLSEGGNPDAPGHFISWLVPREPVRAFVFYEAVYTLDSRVTSEG